MKHFSPRIVSFALALAMVCSGPALSQGLIPITGGTPGNPDAPPDAGGQPPDDGGAGISRPAPGGDAPQPPGPGGSPAATTNLLANNPESIRDAIQAAGFQAILETDSSGNPLIRSKISKSPIWIFFLNCDREGGCRALRFHTGYKLNRQVDFKELNGFMQEYAYARAFLNNEGYPRIQMDVLMRADGMGRENFAYYLDLWRELVMLFEKRIGF
ncbi:YbjN domain-containing protein [Pseudooceanicola sp.]|uniref:YbjN domain-containing protein n=1 Tax=Pseudooceanicola sp. TaxID=1914328 RepID=UPI002629ABCF|nr:YbjN domain-containing protein [Pseudooceanicola sp.]MDF1855191.1 YbjN domain-containing protein [Pseudooceanicola sp.]